ncbi:MAG: S8 family serine peptidase [Candidatus Sumerlaeia bacterium]|nr:S8 family serine peptidase [Candidatus Sumerlaeia bacterium]
MTLHTRLVVNYQAGAALDDRLKLENAYGLTNPRVLSAEMVSYDVPVASEESAGLADRIWTENASLVQFVEPVMSSRKYVKSSTALSAGDKGDPLLKKQWHRDNDGTEENRGGEIDFDLDSPRAWNPNTRNVFGDNVPAILTTQIPRTETGYFGAPTDPNLFNRGVVTVAVFDSGTDINHEDWLRNTDDTDPDPGGFSVIDSRLGFDYLSNEVDPDPDNGDSHGTSVAGIIGAARNNGLGISGIAPDVQILSYRLVETGAAASNESFAAAILDAGIAKQADLGNHSYGGLGSSLTEESAFRTVFLSGRFGLGMSNFVASGNEYTYISYPALYDSTFAVGAMDRDGRKSAYSSFGGTLDFVGMADQLGQDDGILTLDITGNSGNVLPDSNNPDNPNGNYDFDFNGTSSATPSVVGVAALVLAEAPTLTSVELFNRLANTADRVGEPLEYVGIENNTHRHQITIQETDEEGNLVNVVAALRFGFSNGFRKGFSRLGDGFFADGFSHQYGYGKPNPWRAITTQYAESPLRDYVDDTTPPINPETGEPDETFVADVWTTASGDLDLGELELVWNSNFTTDFFDLYNSYAADVEDPGSAEGIAQIAELVREDAEQRGPWVFEQSRRVPQNDPEDLTPKEIGYELTSEVYFTGSFEFDYPSNAVRPNVQTNRYFISDLFPVVFTLSRQTRPEESISFIGLSAAVEDNYYNPRGRYLNNTNYFIQSNDNIIIENAVEGLPLFIDVTLRHDFGYSNVTYDSDLSLGGTITERLEHEVLFVFYEGRQIGEIYGSSDNNVTFPLLPPNDSIIVEFDDDTEDVFATWGPFVNGYTPEKGLAGLPFRTYRFFVPADLRNIVENKESPTLRFELGSRTSGTNYFDGVPIVSDFELNSGLSYIPEYDFNTEDPVKEEVFLKGSKRDFPGCEIAEIKFWQPDPSPDETTGLTANDILDPAGIQISSRGTKPVFGSNGDELFFISSTESADSLDEVRVALGDGIERTQSGATPVVVNRNSVRLMKAETDFPNATSVAPKFSDLAIDYDSSLMGYIIDDPSALERVFISTQDGFDEYAIFPAENGVQKDADIKDISFSRFSEEIYLSTESEIIATEPTGTLREVILSTAGTKLRGFQDVTSINNDTTIVFSAINTNGDRDIYLVARNLSTPGFANLILKLAAWPNSDESSPSVSPDGKVLVFASNTVNREEGAIPTANDLTQLYLLADLDLFLQFNNGTLISDNGLALQRDLRKLQGATNYAGGRFPQFDPTDGAYTPGQYRIVYEGINANSDVAGDIAVIEVNGVEGDDAVVSDQFFPDDEPNFAIQPEITDNIVSQIGRTDFNTLGDGWTFTPITNDSFSDPLSSRAGGSIQLISSGNNNTFGFFASPQEYVKMFPSEFALTQTSDFNSYLVRFYVQRTSTNAVEAPHFRARMISVDGQDEHEVTVKTPVGLVNPYVPALNTYTPVDLIFQPNTARFSTGEAARFYKAQFELLNTTAGDDPFGGYKVDRVDVFRLEKNTLHEVSTLRRFNFDAPVELTEWEPVVTSGSPAPTLQGAADGLSVRVNGSTNTVASWRSLVDAVEAVTTGVEGDLIIRMIATVDAGQTSATQLPVLELKLQDQNGLFESVHRLNPITGGLAPTSGNTRRYQTFWRVSPALRDQILDLQGEFIVRSVNKPSTTSAPVTLREVEFDLVRIPGYPAVDPLYVTD